MQKTKQMKEINNGQQTYVESETYSKQNNPEKLKEIVVPDKIKKQLVEPDAELTSYTKSKTFAIVDEEGNTSIITKDQAKEMKEKFNVNSLTELVDNEKAKEKLKKAKTNKQSKGKIKPRAQYDSDSVYVWDITGELYTYTLSAYNGYNSRAQFLAEYTGVTLLPNGSDDKNDFISSGWGSDTSMFIESLQAWTYHTFYGGSTGN